MKKTIKSGIKTWGLVICLCLAGISPSMAANRTVNQQHPYYLHALSDLRAARWLIEHHPGDWKQTPDEVHAVEQIDVAIRDLKEASIDDGKNVDDHPPVDERSNHTGRLHEARDFLNKAHQDINHKESQDSTDKIRKSSFKHIDQAVNDIDAALHHAK